MDASTSQAAAAAAAGDAGADGGGGAPPDAGPGPVDMPYVHTSLTQRYQGRFQQLSFPTFEQMMAEDAMNNCGVRSAIACAGGAVLGVAFGIFMGSVDTGVRLPPGRGFTPHVPFPCLRHCCQACVRSTEETVDSGLQGVLAQRAASFPSGRKWAGAAALAPAFVAARTTLFPCPKFS
jgi:hypothetical protein